MRNEPFTAVAITMHYWRNEDYLSLPLLLNIYFSSCSSMRRTILMHFNAKSWHTCFSSIESLVIPASLGFFSGTFYSNFSHYLRNPLPSGLPPAQVLDFHLPHLDRLLFNNKLSVHCFYHCLHCLA